MRTSRVRHVRGLVSCGLVALGIAACSSDAVPTPDVSGNFARTNAGATRPPTASLSGSTIDFGLNDCGGAAPANKTITLTNSGGGTLTWAASLDATQHFSLVAPTTGSIAAGASQAITVHANPVPSSTPAAGVNRGTLLIATNDTTRSATDVPLLITAQGATLQVIPSTASFGFWPVGAQAPNVPVTISNTGNKAATVSVGAPTSADFAFNWPANSLLAPGGSASGNARFKASAVGSWASSSGISVTGAVCGNSAAAVPLAGQGADGVVGMSPGALTFQVTGCSLPVQLPASQTITLANTGNAPFAWSASLASGNVFGVSQSSGLLLANSQVQLTINVRQGAGVLTDTLTVTTTVQGDVPHAIPLEVIVPQCLLCLDRIKDGNETGVDCGGGTCGACATGVSCVVSSDCQSQICTNNLCQPPPCQNGIKDGSETAVDCGGTCNPCSNGASCLTASDCQSAICFNSTCQDHCKDGILDADEAGVDCGGRSCAACADGVSCLSSSDCQSGICTGGVCAPGPSCVDGLRNANETGVDCGGGTCPACAVGTTCSFNDDCQSRTCVDGVCTASCYDGLKDGTETDVDCGGAACPACQTGQACTVASDCASSDCTGNVCQGTCNDGIKNGTETDVDCGGTKCFACANGVGKTCNSDADCQSAGACVTGVCQWACNAGSLQVAFGSTGLDVSDSPSLFLGSQLTAEAWVQPTTSVSQADIMRKPNEYELSLNNGVFQARVWTSAGPSPWVGTQVVTANTWSHVAVVYDGTVIRTYVNGAMSGVTTFAGVLSDTSDRLYVGAAGDGTSVFYGYADEIRISNSLRYSSSFVAPATKFVPDANTSLLFHFDDLTGMTTTSDASGNKNYGTLTPGASLVCSSRFP